MTVSPTLIAFWIVTVFSAAHGASFYSNLSTTLDQLDDYSLLDIFDYLNIDDLAGVAMLGERHKQLILRHYFIPKFGSNETQFYINICSESEGTEVRYTIAGDIRQTYLSRGHNKSLTILSAFCSSFGSLIINGVFADDKLVQNVADVVNTHCINVPQEIRFDAPDTPNVTFEHVTSVDIGFAHNIHIPIDLNKLFPRLNNLIVDDCFPLDQKLPHLQYFEYYSCDDGKATLASFAAHNQQLTSIKSGISWPPFNHLKEISELFPNLETLEVNFKELNNETIPTSMEPIPFRNVKHFVLDLSKVAGFVNVFISSVGQQLAQLEFDRLKSLTFAQGGLLVPGLIDLISQYRELTSLSFETTPLSYDQGRRFIDELPKLKEMTFDCSSDDQVVDVARIMSEANDLERVSIIDYTNVTASAYQKLILQSTIGWIKSNEKLVFNFGLAKSVTFERS